MAPRFPKGRRNRSQNFRSLPEGTESVELLNENTMRTVRYIYKIGARRQSIRHKRLFVDIVLSLVANQNPVLGGGRIYVIQFPSVFDGRNFADWQCADSLPLFRGGHIFCLKSGPQ